MSAASPTYRPPEAREPERRLEDFEEAWQGSHPPALEAFVPRGGDEPSRIKVVAELVKIDIEYRWRRHKPAAHHAWENAPRVEDYVSRYPQLGQPSLPADLIAEEYRVRHCFGDKPGHAEYQRRFPSQWDAIRIVLRAVDIELAAEFGKQDKPAAVAVALPVPEALPIAQPISSAKSFFDILCGCQLMPLPQIDELQGRSWDNAHALGKELLQRGWLTPYQVNQSLQGRGADLVLGPYVLLERLGEGGTGQVFKARHQHMRRVVALKVIRKELLTDAEVLARFYREIQVVSQLDHPNVVHAYDAGPVGPTHCLVMEFVEGIDLARLVKQQGPLPVLHATEYIRQAALGLQHAHERGLVHRDIKPSNLLLTQVGVQPPGQIKLLDLGLARLRRTVDTPAAGIPSITPGALTPVGAVMLGTPDFVAPEQALDFHAADIRADIYSLGCTFYHLLTGRPPFVGGSIARKLLRHQQSQPTSIELLRNDLPPELGGALRRMMAKRPEHRYQSPGEVADVLENWLRTGEAPGGTVSDVETMVQVPVPPPVRRQRGGRWWPWVAASLIAMVGLSVISVPWLLKPPAAVTPPATSPGDTALAPLDQLDPGQIPPGDRFPWQPEELVAVFGKRGHEPVRGVAISSDGHQVAFGGGPNVQVWDLASHRKWSPPAEKINVLSIAFAPGGKTLAWGAEDRKIRLADFPSGEVRTLPNAHDRRVIALGFAPDGKTMASAGDEGVVKLWEGPGRDRPVTLQDKGTPVYGLAYGPQSRLLATGDVRSVRVWEVATHKALHRLAPPKLTPPVRAVAFSPDAGELAAASERIVRLWDLSTPKPREHYVLRGHPNDVTAVAFAPDGRRLVSADNRGILILWDPTSGQERKRWTLPFAVNALAFAPDGRHLATANADGTVYILRLTPR